jgi:HEAT repeat protein
LERAAIDALANIGDAQCVSYLLQKLEAAPPGEGAYLFNSITRISQPQAEATLHYAAAGNKEVSAEQGRTAAIYALENFPDEQTCALLEQIVATEENASVVSAAARTLDNIRKAEPVVAANTAAKADELLLPPRNPLQK